MTEKTGTLYIFQVDITLPEGYIKFLPTKAERGVYKPKSHIVGSHWVWIEGNQPTDFQACHNLANSLYEAYKGTVLC